MPVEQATQRRLQRQVGSITSQEGSGGKALRPINFFILCHTKSNRPLNTIDPAEIIFVIKLIFLLNIKFIN